MSWVKSAKGLASVSEIKVAMRDQQEDALSIAEMLGDKMDVAQARSAITPVKRVTGREKEQPNETPSAVLKPKVNRITTMKAKRFCHGAMPGRSKSTSR